MAQKSAEKSNGGVPKSAKTGRRRKDKQEQTYQTDRDKKESQEIDWKVQLVQDIKEEGRKDARRETGKEKNIREKRRNR